MNLPASVQIQIAALLVSVVVLIVGFSWWWHNRSQWIIAMPPLVYFVHIALFYSLVLVAYFNHVALSAWFQTWSTVLRLHGEGTVISLAFIARSYSRSRVS